VGGAAFVPNDNAEIAGVLTATEGEGGAVEQCSNLDRMLAWRLDPSLLMEAVGLKPDPWQRDVLWSTSKRTLILASRQAGKSEVVSLVALRDALFVPGSLVLMLSRSERQSGELFRRVRENYERLGRPVAARRELTFGLELVNGSRLIALPGDPLTVRGFPGVALVIVDEACVVTDDVFATMMPMLAVSGGAMLCLSTPFGSRGWFHAQWTDGGPSWTRYTAKATDCPRIDPAFLEEQRRVLGPRWFAQEFMCEFVEAEGQCFSSEMIEACFVSGEDVPLIGGF
jgi:hypothetical protein